ncbi:MAG: hypothetical protein D6761_12550 [Candidatus Dadabacteria bacterium]|nr:MAG: hypothetical protein D6761_12550 [Candidatus Dadabacteria bacterium]
MLASLFCCIANTALADGRVPVVMLVDGAELATGATSCPTTIAPQPPDAAAQERLEAEAAASIAAARRAFNLLDPEAALNELEPVVDRMRTRGESGPLHRDAEMLLARIAAFLGDETRLDTAALQLVMLSDDESVADPAVRNAAERARARLWRSGSHHLHVVPSPRRIQFAGQWLDYRDGITIPSPAAAALPVGFDYGAFQVAAAVSDTGDLEPLVQPPIIQRLRGNAPLVWTADAMGPLLLSSGGQIIWRPGEPVDRLCSELERNAPATPEQRRLRVIVPVVIGVVGAATGATLGIVRPWRSTRGNLIIRW